MPRSHLVAAQQYLFSATDTRAGHASVRAVAAACAQAEATLAVAYEKRIENLIALQAANRPAMEALLQRGAATDAERRQLTMWHEVGAEINRRLVLA